MRRFPALTLLAATNDIGTARFAGRPAWDRVGDIVGDPERNRGAVAVRLAPGVGYDPPAFAALRQTILNAIAFRGGDYEGVSIGGASRLRGGEAQSHGKEK